MRERRRWGNATERHTDQDAHFLNIALRKFKETENKHSETWLCMDVVQQVMEIDTKKKFVKW